ncbi:MAG: ABC transporter permease [Kineosporiaceae bacterium]
MIDTLAGLVDWFADPANWTGPRAVPTLLAQHLQITVLTIAVAAAIGLPLGTWLGHVGRGGALATNLSYVGRAAPTFAVLVLLALAPEPFGRNQLSTVTALVLFALPVLLTNAYVGVREVDRDAVDAARGMGLSGWQILTRVELPLAAPFVVGGLRLATTQVIATATIAALVAGGGLGRIITFGFAVQDTAALLAGSILVAGLALTADGLLGLLQRRVSRRPGGERSTRSRTPAPTSAV